MEQSEIERIARHIKEFSQKVNPTRPAEVFVDLLHKFEDTKDRIAIRSEIEKMLRGEATLGYMINNGQAKNFNKWLGGIRDVRIDDLKKELHLWQETWVKALEKDFKEFKEGRVDEDV